MLLSLRAFVSVALLIFFYPLVLANLIFGLLLAGLVSGVVHDHLPAVLGVLTLLAVVWMFVRSTWQALPRRLDKPDGLRLDRTEAPRLWAMVDELSAVVGARPPDTIYLVHEVRVAVHERSKLMGLIGGQRRLYLGMPLLHACSIAQLRAALAHELGHYSSQHVKLGGVTYRGRISLARRVSRIGAVNPAGWIFHGYAWVYRAVHNAVGRFQDLEAELAAVRVAGRDAAAGAPREMLVLETAFRHYDHRHLRQGLATGYAPEDVYASFSALIRAHPDEITDIRAHALEGERSVWHTCAPLADRLAAVMAADDPPSPPDERHAVELLPQAGSAGQELWTQANHGLTLTRLPWAEFPTAVADARLQEGMNHMASVLSRAVDQPVTDVGAILHLIAAGRRDEMVTALAPQPPTGDTGDTGEATARFVAQLAAAFSLAAIRSGVAHWEHAWTGPGARLIGGNLGEVASLAYDPASLLDARTQLANRGIDVTTARLVERRWMDLGKAQAFGYAANCLVAGELTDIFFFTPGLLLAPSPSDRDLRSVDRPFELLRERAELTAIAGSRFIPFAAIAAAPTTRRVSGTYKIVLYTGEEIDIRTDSETIEFPKSGVLATVVLSAVRE